MDLAKGSLLDVASHCIAMSTVEKSPSISDKDVLKFLISGSRVAFLDQNLMINGVTLDVAHANSRSVSGYYSFDRGRGRRGEDQRADGVLDNLIFKSVSHHIKTNFTSGDLMRLEYDEMLRDYRMRLPVKEMIVNWINFDEGNSNGN